MEIKNATLQEIVLMACGGWIEWEVSGSLILPIMPKMESHSCGASVALQFLGAEYLDT